MPESTMNVYVVGTSRTIGYYAGLRLLHKGATVTFLLHKPHVFDGDAAMQQYINDGKARIVKGDALSREDVARGWTAAAQDGPVDVLLCTVSITPNCLCTGSLLAVLSTLPRDQPGALPRIVVTTNMGTYTHPGLYGYSMDFACSHLYRFWDKMGAEFLLLRAQGRLEERNMGMADVLKRDWAATEGLCEEGALPELVNVRTPAVTDAEAPGARRGYTYTVHIGDAIRADSDAVRMGDVGHFIAERLLGGEWESCKGKTVSILDVPRVADLCAFLNSI
ncbi:hypothetical protein DENSPDRAFT_934655 [Dentipellis sp. KUC8613]|nr:hypothetical protein DENSPDRAFT_934655 [Dentipellis sp. KUC8613]